MKDGSETPSSPEPHDAETLATPTLAYTASGNLEAHAIVTWLQSNGVRAYAVEDNSGVSLFAFGTISQFHKPQVFVEESDLQRAGDLLRQFESQRDRRRADLENAPAIKSECEECGV
ncbi:putative signal transducing protein, partial [Rhodopirellula bahusiensis]